MCACEKNNAISRAKDTKHTKDAKTNNSQKEL
jgi:hypothetical protein